MPAFQVALVTCEKSMAPFRVCALWLVNSPWNEGLVTLYSSVPLDFKQSVKDVFVCVTGQHSWSQSQYMFPTGLGDMFRSRKLVDSEGG